jgi:hypothetical protein
MQISKSMRVTVEPLLAIAVVLAAIAICAKLAMAVLASSADIVGMTNAIGACALVLADDAGVKPSAQCVAAVGNRYPGGLMLESCTSALIPHSQTDGRIAALKIGECLERRA